MTQSQNSLPGRALVNESEISGLIEWSLPWVRGLAAVCFLVGLQGIGLAVREMAGAARETFVWELMRGSAGFTLGACLFALARTGLQFVSASDDKLLGKVMSTLSVVWTVLTLTFLATVLALCADLGDSLVLQRTLRLNGLGIALGIFAASLGPVVAVITWRRESHSAYAKETFIKHINPFATRSLPWLRALSVFAIAGGALSTGFGVADYLYDITGGATRVIGSGLVLAAFGAAIQWYRRAVRDIQRNPTPYFFERTLNRLNLLWLLSTVFFAVLFVVGFF